MNVNAVQECGPHAASFVPVSTQRISLFDS